MKKCAEHRLNWSEPAYKGGPAMQGTMVEEARGITGPSLPSNGRDYQTHEEEYPARWSFSHAYSCDKGNAPSWTGSKLLSHERHERRGVMRGCVATPTGQLRKSKPAEAASKRIRHGCIALPISQQGSRLPCAWTAKGETQRVVTRNKQHLQLWQQSGHTIEIQKGEHESRFPPAILVCISSQR